MDKKMKSPNGLLGAFIDIVLSILILIVIRWIMGYDNVMGFSVTDILALIGISALINEVIK